jgi:predicted metal-binding membrane protein
MTQAVEALLRRDRAIVAAGLGGITVLAWLGILRMANTMSEMDMHAAMGMAMPQARSWGPVDVVLLFIMWAVMMVAMMLPSAAPMILIFAAVNRRRHEQGQPFVQTGIFLFGYVVVWTGFSLLAALLQARLHAAALLSPMMVTTSPILGGLLLAAAGVFQWTPLKAACLVNCRSPLSFLMTEWREGAWGAFVMGLRHGAYCVGCCWLLMALLFVAGVMNLMWVAAIAAFVLIEKIVPGGERISRVAGAVLLAAGAIVLARPWA